MHSTMSSLSICIREATTLKKKPPGGGRGIDRVREAGKTAAALVQAAGDIQQVRHLAAKTIQLPRSTVGPKRAADGIPIDLLPFASAPPPCFIVRIPQSGGYLGLIVPRGRPWHQGQKASPSVRKRFPDETIRTRVVMRRSGSGRTSPAHGWP